MRKLALDIPRFKLDRRLLITKSVANGREQIQFQGLDVDDSPYSLFTKIEVTYGTSYIILDSEPFRIQDHAFKGICEVRLHFPGHYGEPSAVISINTTNLVESKYSLVFDPFEQIWEAIVKLN